MSAASHGCGNAPLESARSQDGAPAVDDASGASSFSCSEEAARLIGASASAGKDAQRRRERIALGVFAALVLAGFVVLTSYISNAGRGLNVAATNIDDIAGDMSGYDVLLFEGTVEPDAHAESPDGEGADGRPGIIVPSADSMRDGGRAGADAPDTPASDGGIAPDASADRDADAAPGPGEGDGVMTVEEARAVYEGKKASVIEVDPESLRDYVSGRIVMKDGHSYGIFSLPADMVSELAVPMTTTTKTTTTTGPTGSVDEKTTTRVKSAYGSVSELFAAIDPDAVDPALVKHIRDILARFEAAKVDTVVAFTSDPTPFAAVEGVDAVVTFKTHDRFSMSEVIDGTLYFDAPEKGSVGVLMVAPGNVASTKVLTDRPQ